MISAFFTTMNNWLAGGFWFAAMGAFLWGGASIFFSPCHLASIPLIIGYVGGQDTVDRPRQALTYAVLFALGLFLSITLVGLACLLLGRMLGDIGPYWNLLLGAVLVWVALTMLGVPGCTMPGGNLSRLPVTGLVGAFVLGLAYGVVSGSCTFGFIAPILAIITVQEKVATGTTLLALFALGHTLPIAVAGSSTAWVKKILTHGAMQQASMWFKKLAGVIIAMLGLYFLARPWLPG